MPDSLESAPPETAATRAYSVHGIRVTLASAWPEFLTLSDLLLGAFPREGACAESLSVRLDLRTRGWFESPAVAIERGGDEERWGTNEFLQGSTARFAAGKIVIRYTDGPEADVRASYIFDRSSRLRRALLREQPWEDGFALVRLGVQEPLLLKLEQRGAVLLHASAVALEGRALLLVGLNGSGKTTLCASLLDRLDYVSDNFVAVDGTRVLGFPSALRMPGPSTSGSDGLPLLHGKHFVRPDPKITKIVAEAHALVFLSLGGTTSLTRLSADDALRRATEVQDMTHEFPRHTYLGPLAQPPNPSALAGLVRAVPAYRLVVSRTAGARDPLQSLFEGRV